MICHFNFLKIVFIGSLTNNTPLYTPAVSLIELIGLVNEDLHYLIEFLQQIGLHSMNKNLNTYYFLTVFP